MNDVEVYSFVSQQWRIVNSMKKQRYAPSLVLLNYKLTVFGGRLESVPLTPVNSIEEYDGVTWNLLNKTSIYDQVASATAVVPCN